MKPLSCLSAVLSFSSKFYDSQCQKADPSSTVHLMYGCDKKDQLTARERLSLRPLMLRYLLPVRVILLLEMFSRSSIKESS